jgi:hypothetical protein
MKRFFAALNRPEGEDAEPEATAAPDNRRRKADRVEEELGALGIRG